MTHGVPRHYAEFLQRQAAEYPDPHNVTPSACQACGSSKPAHVCGPKEWAAHQGDLLQRMLVAINRQK